MHDWIWQTIKREGANIHMGFERMERWLGKVAAEVRVGGRYRLQVQREKNMIKGSCLCGAIEYEVELILEKIFNCHCSQCRKSHGAAFATQAFAKGSTLKFLKGEESLKEYTGHGGVRAFCANCGSRLMNYAPDKNLYLSVALSCVDSPHTGTPVAHANVDSKAPWHRPSENIPSYPGMPDGALD